MNSPDDFALPSLAPQIRITRAPDSGGEPFWTLHHPVSNSYYKIDWMTFEALSRFSRHKTAQDLKATLENETTITITIPQIMEIVQFLQRHTLTALEDQRGGMHEKPKTPLWKRIFHGYLYLTIPLFQPQEFLRKTYPRIAFLFSRPFVTAMMAFFAVMVLYTLPRLDEFFHTFTNMLSIEGAIRALIVLAFVKIVHEWAHAYTATKYGVDVPHMGIALIVLYPVLYTETTASWQLPSRRARFHIGMAGIVSELCLAAIFLVFWHMSPPGSALQTASFLVVAVALISSLLVNLNPLMRFDGYYMFSDATGIDNLQSRSIAFARWRLREILFGLKDPFPEEAPESRRRLLITFGISLLVYRFFLFMGIALLVYHVFFQPLGLLLMLVEILWFIVLPIWSEVKVWYEKRDQIFKSRHSLFLAFAVFAALVLVLLPWKGTLVLPAVLHAGSQFDAYAPAPSQIIAVHIEDGQQVEEGDVIAQLQSSDLENSYKSALQDLQKLETLRRRAASDPVMMQSAALSEEALEKARLKLESYRLQKERLIIRAPFSGRVRDLGVDIHSGRYISTREKLFTLIDTDAAGISAYATEDEQQTIEKGSAARFRAGSVLSGSISASVASVSQTGQDALPWPELSSLHGGPIAADRDPDGAVATRRAVYEISATVENSPLAEVASVQTGYLYVITEKRSLFMRWIKELAILFRREGKIG